MNTIELNNNRIQKMNDCLTAYLDEEGEVEKYELKLELDGKNKDIIEFLVDYGLAGKIKTRLMKMLRDYTKGYIEWKQENTGGRWTKDCDKFRAEI